MRTVCVPRPFGRSWVPQNRTKAVGRLRISAAETRCFISSLEKDALNQLNIMCKNCKIENNLRWQLDVSFMEDDAKMKKNQLPKIAVLRKMAMPVLKAFTYKKGASMKKKMLAAALKPNVKKEILQTANGIISKILM
jgi:predicted transposase YbfD/YdcC